MKDFDEISIESKADTESEIGFERPQVDRVKFDEVRGRSKIRDGLFPIASNVSIGSGNSRIPTTYKTISHSIDERLKDEDEEILDFTWHTDEIDQICNELDVDLDRGLTPEQVQKKIKQFGKNILSKPDNHLFTKIFFYFFNGFGFLLLAAGILVIICYKPLGDPPAVANLILGIILLVVFVIQAFLNFIQDYSSSQILNSINFMLPNELKCFRDGNFEILDSTDLVPGDIVMITKESKIPADLRIIELNGLSFDKCILTGETKPIKGKVYSDKANYMENESIAMQGSLCIDGNGKGIVVCTGDQTVFGRISKLSSKQKPGLTSLQKELFRFILIVVILILFVNIILIILWAAWLRHLYPDWISVPTLIVDIVSVTVAFIPEGLPVAMTVCLIVSARKMREHGVLVKSLATIETFGAMNVLCSDKTGTLTSGKMVVSNFQGNSEDLRLIGRLCNECRGTTRGNPTDRAIMAFSESYSFDESEYERVQELGFNSKNKYMIKIFAYDGRYLFTTKGAPETLIEKASFIHIDDKRVELTDELRQKLIHTQFNWCNNGERVVLMGSRWLTLQEYEKIHKNKTEDDELSIDDYQFDIVGLVGISDPLRPGIPESIRDLKVAHIKIVMITGDFEITAKSIATSCGIVSATAYVDGIDNIGLGNDCIIINGSEMFRMSEIEWDKMMEYDLIIFSRTTPEQKLKIVKEIQDRKNVVAMIGDGVNDSPSIKQADIGISMVDASEIAKDASDIILMDSFVSIIHGIKFGRLVFHNLKKTICYLLPAGSYSELWPVILNVIFGFPQMLSSFLMIIICCITDCVAAMIISFEKEESNILKEPPRQVKGEKLVNLKLLLHSYLTLGTYYSFTSMLLAFLNFKREGFSFGELHKYALTDEMNNVLSRSSSIYFINLVILQFFNLITVRTRYASCFRNMNLKLLVIVPIFGSTFIWNYIPKLQTELSTDTIPVEYYFISIGFGVIVLVYDELRKLVVRRKPNSMVARIAW